MSGYWLRRESEHLAYLAQEGAAVRHMSAAIGRTAKDVTAHLARIGYGIDDVSMETRRKIVAMRKAGSSTDTIARETGIQHSKVVRILAVRGIAWRDPAPPPEPYVDPWDRPRTASKPANPAQVWPF